MFVSVIGHLLKNYHVTEEFNDNENDDLFHLLNYKKFLLSQEKHCGHEKIMIYYLMFLLRDFPK